MKSQNPAQAFFETMELTFKDMMATPKMPVAFDMKTVMDAQRKNMQAITEANQRAMTGWQTMAQRQAEMVSQFVQDNSALARETMKEGTPQEKFSRQADILKKACQTSIANTQELAEMMRKNSMEAAELLNRRLVDTISEIKNSTAE